MKKYLVLDTETTNSLDDPITYDIGWAVIDENGEVYETASYVVADVFLDKELMESAYFVDKIPQYWEDIKNGERVLARFKTIRFKLIECCKRHNVRVIMAHNARFDYLSTNNTIRWLTKSKYRYFLPYGIEVWDTLKMARSVIGKMPTYRKFCEENGYTYGNNQLRFTAEILYQFITKDTDFTEEHTGLSDVMIEKEILAYCYRQHKPMKKKLWGE